MSQDSDVDRLAAALKRPSLRYHSFGNGPTRTPQVPTPDSALPEPVAPPAAGLLSRLGAPPDPTPPDPTPPEVPAPPLPLPDPEPPARPAPSHTLLDHLRSTAAAPAPPGEGLLALLSQPAVWDLPPAAAAAPPPLAGRPILPGLAGEGLLARAAAVAPEAAPPAPAPPIGTVPAGTVPLAAMFRLVTAPPAAAAARTDPLQDVLRGLRPARRD